MNLPGLLFRTFLGRFTHRFFLSSFSGRYTKSPLEDSRKSLSNNGSTFHAPQDTDRGSGRGGGVERLRGQSQIEWMSVEEHLSLSLPRSVVSGGVAGGSGTRGTGGVEFLAVVGGGAIRGPSRVPGNNRHPQLLHPPAGKRTESLHSLLLIHPLGVLVVDLV